jgi:hypothetical protein
VRQERKVTHVLSGETRYFRSPATLYKVLLTTLSNDPSRMRGLGSHGEESASADEGN